MSEQLRGNTTLYGEVAGVSFTGEWDAIRRDLSNEMGDTFITSADHDLASYDPTEEIPVVDLSGVQPYGKHAWLNAAGEPIIADSNEATQYMPKFIDDGGVLAPQTGKHALQTGRHRLEDTMIPAYAASEKRGVRAVAERMWAKRHRIGAVAVAAVVASGAASPAVAAAAPRPAAVTTMEIPAVSANGLSASMEQAMQASADHVGKYRNLPAKAKLAEQTPPPTTQAPPKEAPPIMPPAPADKPHEPRINSWVCDPNVTYAMKYLMDNGMTAEGAAGLLANAKAESGIIPNRVQGAGMRLGEHPQANVGYGLLQWTTSDRQAGLIKFANGMPAPENRPSSLKAQLGFAIQELKASYKSLWNKLTSGGSSASADAAAFMTDFERPKDHAPNGPNAQKRSAAANQIMADYPRC